MKWTWSAYRAYCAAVSTFPAACVASLRKTGTHLAFVNLRPVVSWRGMHQPVRPLLLLVEQLGHGDAADKVVGAPADDERRSLPQARCGPAANVEFDGENSEGPSARLKKRS